MQQVVSFPGLGLEFHLSNIAFHIASKPIYWYGILIMCGVILAVVYASRRCSAFGIKQDDMYDCVLFAVPLGIVCARIYYVIFEWEQYKNDLSEVFAIWHGGLAIYGGILGGIVVVAAVCRFKGCLSVRFLDDGAISLTAKHMAVRRRRRGAWSSAKHWRKPAQPAIIRHFFMSRHGTW